MKELSRRNKQRRAQQTMLHCTGRRSFAQISDKKVIHFFHIHVNLYILFLHNCMISIFINFLSTNQERSTGVEPSRLDVFDVAYRRSDGTFSDPVAEQKGEEISRLRREREQGLNSYSEEDMFRLVFGRERDGRVRCIGYVLTPTVVFGRQRAV
ncbi:uncharacterized protein LOC119987188 isoform X1 [Tripterygium wilfordii]|uniref:uncharacterized protein LOC119987188 isoform X1 n=1 Tax=Tripterygium wilfordii TaxID=458696 RepID=UPI0018F8388D|nr:uncharacterized protein LOC119987188 isoform X1 [Tripterygium wilfordii]XP_038687938.1 uncharacterized protein LOC119987188 isoform X1 [Tripterygium wilfordii]XP_038687947.1 uncharacterized protein LOC119987188 isoform X1 [Tripterygium wilfordii]XP_038687953.1 uncharacterized protein LOC119987188 isoform X1 [Tripterygium wilfordii]